MSDEQGDGLTAGKACGLKWELPECPCGVGGDVHLIIAVLNRFKFQVKTKPASLWAV